jgi:hypothetical protein
MLRQLAFGLLLSALCASVVLAQPESTVTLSGSVKNSKTNEAIPRASIMILGSSKGVIANSQGKYSIHLERGKTYRLRIRAIGYRDDTLTITISERTNRDILLEEQAVTGQEVVVRGDASRIEARRIMREVIKRSNFTAKAYSRWNYKTISGDEDSTVRSVIESVADVYWKKGKGIAERIVARKQTANLPPELNTFSVGEIVNFYDDRIDFGEYNLPSPLADDAFDTYDYDLLEKDVRLFGSTYSVIAVETGPLSPAFIGKLWIDESDYSVGYLELQTNRAVELGPVSELRFEQQFDDVAGEYQLPIDLHMVLGIKLQLPFVPRLHFEQLSVLKDYEVNAGVHDSLFEGRKHVALPTADSVSPETWQQERAIPLTGEEEEAYKRIDSTVAISQEDTAGSFWSTVLDILPSPDIPVYNQVEGLRLSVSKEITPIDTFPLSFRGNLAYGFKDERFKYRLHAEQGLIWTVRRFTSISGGLSGDISGVFREEPEVTLSLGADLFDVYHERGNAYPSILTSITSLIYKEDYQEYYRGNGYSFELNYYPYQGTSAQIQYVSQKLTDVGTDSLQIVSGTSLNATWQYNSIAGVVSTRFDAGFADLRLDVNFLTTSKSFSSDYEFSTAKLDLGASMRLGGLGKVEITARYHTALSGALPRWNLFFFETRNKFFSSSNNFRGLRPFEFMGEELWMLYAEHNFYDLPMRLVGIEPSEYLDFHWFLFGGIGGTKLQTSSDLDISTTKGRPYGEIGVGIGNIFNIVRFEGTWRLTHKGESNFYPTVSLGFTF